MKEHILGIYILTLLYPFKGRYKKMFYYNNASGFDTNYAVINSKRFLFCFVFLFKLENSCSKKSMGFPLYMSLFCALFTEEQRSTSFIRQRTKAGFH